MTSVAAIDSLGMREAAAALPDQVADAVGNARLYGMPPDFVQTYRVKLGAVTSADVQAAARATIRPDAAAIVVVGDGAFQFNIQELQTVVRNRLPIKILLIDNRCHGSVRQFQEENLEGRYPTTVIDYDTPDFTRVAEAYGIRSREVTEPESVGEALSWFWEDPMEAALLRVEIPMLLNVYPNVPFGAPLSVMAGRADLEPCASRADAVVPGR